MTVVQKAGMRSMRIIALPLTRPIPRRKASPPQSQPVSPSTVEADSIPSPKALTYYHVQLSPSPTAKIDLSTIPSLWQYDGSVVKWMSEKAAAVWAGFGKAPEGSWKLRTFQYGERLVDRIDFEELALKGVDPSFGPRLREHESKSVEKGKDAKTPEIIVPLIYPPSLDSSSSSLARLQFLIAYRTPRHRKGFYMWMIIAPFTAPFMVIPIIPNLPFFFCVWRSWSHYRAYRASQYLESLLDSGAIVPQASQQLDKIYDDFALPAKRSVSSSPSTSLVNKSTQEPLLTRDAVPVIVARLKLKESADMYRAVEQARVRIKAGLV